MNYNLLKGTNIFVSSIGFGTWGIGGPTLASQAYGYKDRETSIKALLKAKEKGINFYDTASSYGEAEVLLGEVFQNNRKEIVISTKGGYRENFVAGGTNQDFGSVHIESSILRSLARLKTDYIDIYHLHDCPLSEIKNNPKLFDMLTNYRKSEIIKAIGFSGKSSLDTIEALDIFPFDVIQIGLSLVDMRPIIDGLIQKCIQRNISIIARSCLAFGFLTNEAKAGGFIDHRSKFSERQRKLWIACKELCTHIYHSDNGLKWSNKAINFALSCEGVSVVNIGMNNSRQVEENIQSLDSTRLSSIQIGNLLEVYKFNYHNKVIERQ